MQLSIEVCERMMPIILDGIAIRYFLLLSTGCAGC